MCDTLVSLTDDGVLFAKNSDRDVNEAQRLRFHPAAVHRRHSLVSCTWSAIPQAPHTHAVLLSQPWWMWGAEMGVNEHGVVIGNEAVFTRRAGTDSAPGRLLGMDLVRLGLERGATRDQAVEVIVTLLEQHGQGGSCSVDHPRFSYDNSYLIADREGAIVLETAGRHWAIEHVTERGRSISNGLTIPGFSDAYADRVKGSVAHSTVRRHRTDAAAQHSRNAADMMGILRDHGAPAPRYRLLNGALSAPCAHAGGLLTSTQTTASMVADLGAGEVWATGTAAPCTSVFKPVAFGPVPPALGDEPQATDRYDPAVTWWRHELLHRTLVRDPGLLTEFGIERDALERQWRSDPPSDPWADAEEFETRWLERAGDPADSRPSRVRSQWRNWDADAGLPGARRAGLRGWRERRRQTPEVGAA